MLVCLSTGNNSWVDVILAETHDFSRAVDGLVKEIYLGMIFLQLQVRLIGHFRVAFCLSFKARSSAKPLI